MKRASSWLDELETTTEAMDKKKRIEDAFDHVAIESFIRDGFVLLPEAFSPSTAQECREVIWHRLAQDGITKDPTTWVERHGIAGLYH